MSPPQHLPAALTLQSLLLQQALQRPGELAYAFLDNDLAVVRRFSFGELLAAIEPLARALEDVTLPGDRVLLAYDNDPEAVLMFWAAVLAGRIPVPAPAPDRHKVRGIDSRLGGIAANAGISLAFTDPERLEAGQQQTEGVRWTTADALRNKAVPAGGPAELTLTAAEDLAYLQYTSGSTSMPRGVRITHAALLAHCAALSSRLTTPDTKGLVWLPWFHDYGLIHGVIQPIYLGCPSYLMPTNGFLTRPLRWLEAIDRFDITHTGAPDFAFAACVKALARVPQWSARLDRLVMASCGAEPVLASTLDAFSEAFAPYGLRPSVVTPSYGLAEAVLAVTVCEPARAGRRITVDQQSLENGWVRPVPLQSPGSRTVIDCGSPLPGLEIQIIEHRSSKPCAAGQVGEIWVRGASIARGYWGAADASAETFQAVCMSLEAVGARFLRTGDLGFLSEGGLFITGRLKDMIVIGGRNLYPQDIERTAEGAWEGIRSGGVMAISADLEGREGVVLLVEFRVRSGEVRSGDVVSRVRKRVASEHAIEPHDVVLLRVGALPRTSSGKPQRQAAARMYKEGVFAAVRLPESPVNHEVVTAPSMERHPGLEGELQRLWCEVLGVTSVSSNAQFFDQGGDSLLATQLVSRIRSRFGVEFRLQLVFEYPTLLAMAAQLSNALDDQEPTRGHPTPEPLGTARAIGAVVPLSYSQERMWLMHELEPDSAAYNMPLAIRLKGSVDFPALRGALSAMVSEHEILRTRFVKTADGVSGMVEDPIPVVLDVTDLNDPRAQVTARDLPSALAQSAGRPFHLNRLPLIRAEAFCLAPDETVLLLVMHHIVGDQWSFAVLGRALAQHYSRIRAGQGNTPRPTPIQYADYTAWHRHWFNDDRLAGERRYWLRQLGGLEPVTFPEDFPRPKTVSHRGGAVRLPLEDALIDKLQRLGASQGASLSMVLMAALNVLLMRHTGRSDIGIGVPIANRHHLASEDLIGTFVNTLVCRTHMETHLTFTQVLERVRGTCLAAYAHQDMPFEVLVRELGLPPTAGRTPLFGVMFNMVNAPTKNLRFDDLQWERVDFDRGAAQFDLSVVADTAHDRSIVFEYASDLYARETIERLSTHMERLLHLALSGTTEPVGDWQLAGPAEYRALAAWGAGEVRPLVAATIPAWLGLGTADRQCVALISGETAWTYAELETASNRWAHLLRQRGARRGTRVGVCLPRGNSLVAVLIGILKAGAAYVPLDPSFPQERLRHQIDDAQPLGIVSTAALEARIGGYGVPVILADHHPAGPDKAPSGPIRADPQLDARAEDPAYVIYTSGSTGVPKGVVVPHRAVVNFLASVARRPGLAASDRLLAVTTVGFDIAVLELLLPLGVGASVVIATEVETNRGDALLSLLQSAGITAMQATPSRWHLLLEAGWEGTPGLKVLVGGETLNPKLAGDLLVRCSELWNMYGPTETTVWSSCWQVTEEALPSIALGQPLDNTTIEVRDTQGHVCPIGTAGEIWIGGLGVASGYHERADLTAERFTSVGASQEPYYRTGDLGRWRHNGLLEHLGRMDDQVKVRGFRIELGEIETRLQAHPAVAQAVVTVREDPSGDSRLIAYVVPRNGVVLRTTEVKDYLRTWLPEHMLPAATVRLDAIPLLANGKTNRRALPPPADDLEDQGVEVAKPRTPEEVLIWEVWRDILQLSGFGIDSSFFELGGHSLLAVRAARLLEVRLGLPVPLRLVFDHPTVRGLAAAMTSHRASANPQDPLRPIATLQPHGSNPPLFLLAGAEMYRSLARHLGTAFPVYGLYSQVEIDILHQPANHPQAHLNIQGLARDYLAIIRSVQAHGPYFMGGFSIGGVLAFEVAQLLRREGESVGLLVLLDSMLPGRSWGHTLAGLRRRWRLLKRDGLGHIKHVLDVIRQKHAQRNAPGEHRIRQYAAAIQSYNATPSDVRVLFLQADGDPSTDVAYGWSAYLPNIEVHRVPGRHMDILESPGVEELAGHIRTHMARTPTTPTGRP